MKSLKSHCRLVMVMTRLEEMEAGCIEKQQIQFVKCGDKSLFKGLIKKIVLFSRLCFSNRHGKHKMYSNIQFKNIRISIRNVGGIAHAENSHTNIFGVQIIHTGRIVSTYTEAATHYITSISRGTSSSVSK